MSREQDDEHSKIDLIQQLQPTVTLNDSKQETLSTEFSNNHSDDVIIETATRVFVKNAGDDANEKDESDKIDHADRNIMEVSDSIEDDQKQTLSYPNETLEKGQDTDESDTDKSASGGK